MNGFLYRVGPAIRMMVTKRIQLKYSPDLVYIRTDYARKEEALDVTIERMQEQQTLQKTQMQLQDEDAVEDEEEEDAEEQKKKDASIAKSAKKTPRRTKRSKD